MLECNPVLELAFDQTVGTYACVATIVVPRRSRFSCLLKVGGCGRAVLWSVGVCVKEQDERRASKIKSH